MLEKKNLAADESAAYESLLIAEEVDQDGSRKHGGSDGRMDVAGARSSPAMADFGGFCVGRERDTIWGSDYRARVQAPEAEPGG
jgi:hypothetical protein